MQTLPTLVELVLLTKGLRCDTYNLVGFVVLMEDIHVGPPWCEKSDYAKLTHLLIHSKIINPKIRKTIVSLC